MDAAGGKNAHLGRRVTPTRTQGSVAPLGAERLGRAPVRSEPLFHPCEPNRRTLPWPCEDQSLDRRVSATAHAATAREQDVVHGSRFREGVARERAVVR